MMEPELITIIEGPTPDFMPNPQMWVQSVLEGPEERDVAVCQLRTATGKDIMAPCQRAWHEGRAVVLDYPDDLRMRQQVDVIALRLEESEAGEVLLLWVSLPVETEEEEEEEELDDEDLDSDVPF
jgi:hypothetical protein